jgi:hypothetical protein
MGIVMRRWLKAICLGLAVLLAGCGGGGGGGGGDGPTVSGSVVKGPVLGATVCAYALSAGARGGQLALGLATGAQGSISNGCYVTPADGSYSFSLPAGTTGDILLEATGGSFCTNETPIVAGACPGGGTLVNLGGAVMSSAVTLPGGNAPATVHTTPLSTAAVNAAAGAGFSAATFQTQFNALAGQIIGANSGVTPSTAPNATNQPYLVQVGTFLQSGGSMTNAVASLQQGSTNFTSGANGTTSAAAIHASLVGSYNLVFAVGGGAGCGSACSYTDGQSVSVTVHSDGRLSIPGKTLDNPFYRHYGANPHLPEIIWLDSQANVEYALTDNSSGSFNEINVGNAANAGVSGIPQFLGQLRQPSNSNPMALLTALAGSYPLAYQYKGANVAWTGVTIGSDGAISFTGGAGPSVTAANIVQVSDWRSCCGYISVQVGVDLNGDGVNSSDVIKLFYDNNGALRSIEYDPGNINVTSDDVGVRVGTVAALAHDGTVPPSTNAINGTANGTVLNFAPSFTSSNAFSLLLHGEAGGGTPPALYMQLAPNQNLQQGSTYPCRKANMLTVTIMARLTSSAPMLTTDNGGRCEITVTQLTTDGGGNVTEIRGTFTAEMVDTKQTSAPVTITNGVFRYAP